ncbi:MAG: diguanylate cyclase, partial [Sphaerochaetaceae bacterium]
MEGIKSKIKILGIFAISIFLLLFFSFSLNAQKLNCGWNEDGYSQQYDSNGVFSGPAFSLYQTFFKNFSIEKLEPDYSFAYTEIGFVDYILLADFNQSAQKIKNSKLFFSSPLINLSYNFIVNKNQTVLWNGWNFLNEGKIGILNTDNIDIIQDYLNNLKKSESINFEITIYTNLEDMKEDLFSGKINTMLVNSLYSSKDLKVMFKTPILACMVFASSDEDKINQLNNSIVNLNETRPDYFNTLFDSYLKPSNFGGIVFTRDEAAFLYSHPTLNAAISFQQEDLISLDYGVYSGSVYNIFEKISELTSIKWKYEPQMYVSLSDQNFDVHMCCYEDTDFAIANGLNLTQGYMSIPFEIVSSNNIIRRIALEKDSGYNNIIIRNYPECEFEYFATSSSCIGAVKNRTVDGFIAPFYVVQDNLTQKDIESGVIVKYIDDFSIKMSSGVSKNVDPILVDILNKALNFIDLDRYERQLFEKIDNNFDSDFSKGIIIRENYTTVSWMVFVAILIILMFIVFVFYFGYRKKVETFLYYDEALSCYNQKGFERRVEELQKVPSTKFQYLVNFTISHLNESGTATGINKGDQVVRNIATLLDTECTQEECYGRVQADNFIVLLTAREDTDFNLRVKELERKIRFLQKNSLLILNI